MVVVAQRNGGNVVHAPKEYVEHLFREALRESQLTALEKRRPRTFGGMGARLDRTLTLSDIAACDTKLDKSLLIRVMAGAIWTADRAHRRRLRPNGDCPYCPREVQEDEDHLLWRCTTWKTVRDPLLPEIMLLARALKLGPLCEWPPCLRLCGLLLESVVARSGQAQGPGWKKRCRELNRISRHQIPDSEDEDLESGRQRDELALAGHQWAEEGNNPLEQFVHKLAYSERCCRPECSGRRNRTSFFRFSRARCRGRSTPGTSYNPLDPGLRGPPCRPWGRCPETRNGVMTSYRRWSHGYKTWNGSPRMTPCRRDTGRSLSWNWPWTSRRTRAGPCRPPPQSRFTGTELSLQEKGTVVHLAVTPMGKAAGRESILRARITNHCRSLVPLGAGPVVGVKGRPSFTRPMAVWHHLKCLQKYNAERWAQQQSRVAKQRQKRRCARGQLANGQNDNTRPRERCPGKGGAKKAAGAYASDFYAGPVLPEGARRGVQYRVEEPSGDAATSAPGGGSVLFTPPQRCAVARRPETRARLRGCGFALRTITWVGGCGTAAPGDIQDTPPTDTAWGTGQSESGGAAHPRRGGTPSAKRPKRHQQASVSRGQAFKRGRGHPDPPPPPCAWWVRADLNVQIRGGGGKKIRANFFFVAPSPSGGTPRKKRWHPM